MPEEFSVSSENLTKRRSELSELQRAWIQEREKGQKGAFIFLQLGHGRSTGQVETYEFFGQCLESIAREIRQRLGGKAEVVRLESASILIFLPDLPTDEILRGITDAVWTIASQTKTPLTSYGGIVPVAATAEGFELARQLAMYAAEKQLSWQRYSEEVLKEIHRQIERKKILAAMISETRNVLHGDPNEKIAIALQPIVPIAEVYWDEEGKRKDFEALMRLQLRREDRYEFKNTTPCLPHLPFDEKMQLAEAVCRLTVAQIATLGRPISLNLSLDLLRDNFHESIITTAERANIPPDHLGIELLEIGPHKIPTEIAEKLSQLTDAGHRLMIDDFGRDASSADRICDLIVESRVRIDTLKLDGNVTQGLVHKPEAYQGLIGHHVQLASSLGIPNIVVEWVENDKTLKAVLALNEELQKITHVQGNFIGRPRNILLPHA